MSSEKTKLDEMDRRLMQLLQDEFPLDERPWEILAARLGISAEEVLSRTKRLLKEGIVRKIFPVLNAYRLGTCDSTLIAMRVPPERMEEVASIVNEYKTVTHNYEREHDFNLWFTITACGEGKLQETIEEIKRRTRIPDKDILDLRTTRVFKIDVRFQFISEGGELKISEASPPFPNAFAEAAEGARGLSAGIGEKGGGTKSSSEPAEAVEMDEQEKRILHALQDGIPAEERPFDAVASRLGISTAELLARLRRLIQKGIVKRFGASFDQRKIGIVANAVIAWKVPPERTVEVGVKLSQFRGVTHCYERKTAPPQWEYNLFTVVHGYDRSSVEEYAKMLAEAVGIKEYVVLFSSQQFKRASIGAPH